MEHPDRNKEEPDLHDHAGAHPDAAQGRGWHSQFPERQQIDTAQLPVDIDGADDNAADAPPPAHVQWRYVALIAAGGAAGTGLRQGLSLLFPPPEEAGVPYIIAGINISGAFVLGLLLQSLQSRGDDTGRRRALRLFAGTGVLGGFTTYSALATDTVLLLDHSPAAAMGYALGTVLLGAAASFSGIAAGTVRNRKEIQ
ncbi:fluoride efflux transporter FluC [Arthrobacter yangruifuii]|uniref:fluoride efflux transporter FluC n=1 Tax=Arthrobacter yangruifuii TaxID=2606616 RepID=UPI001FED5C7A|nr:CrcB family protein [Arthrobacter yangruifuii]